MSLPVDIYVPRISTVRVIPENGATWKPTRIQVRTPQKSTLIHLLNWAGWMACLAIPVSLMVWMTRETPRQRQVRVELQEVQRQESMSSAYLQAKR